MIKYTDELLTDERTTLGDVNRSSLTFRISELDMSITNQTKSNAKIQGEEQFVKWNKKYSTKVPIRNPDFSFGMYHLSAIALMVLLPLVALHLYEYLSRVSDSNRIVNFVELYTLLASMRNVHAVMRQALLSTVFWNNSAPILGRPAADTYLQFSRTMRDSVVSSLNARRGLDYGGAFLPFFANLTADYSVCELITRLGTGYGRCGQKSLTSMDVNFVMFLRSVVSLTDDVFLTWQTQNGDAGLAAELVRVPKFANYLGISHNFSSVDELYYLIMKPLSAAIVTQLETQISQDVSGSSVK